MIRIKDVAVGYYDTSMLDYRINEGPRSRWLTGEIYVSEGLEDALNIDRDSFNKFHPQYKALQTFIHYLLQKTIFPSVYRQIEVRSEKRADAKQEAHEQHLKQVLKSHTGATVNLKQTVPADDDEPSVQVTETAMGFTLNLPAQETLKTQKNHRQLASAILAVFEMSLREPGKEKQRNFTSLSNSDLACYPKDPVLIDVGIGFCGCHPKVLSKLHRQGHLKVGVNLRRRLKGIIEPFPEVAVDK
jgi:hypothetical protein